MIRAMSQLIRSGSAMESRAASPSSVWEVVGVLAAIVPSGILAGLYLATSDTTFLVACAVFAAAAVGIVYFRRPGRLSWAMRRRAPVAPDAAGVWAERASGRLTAARSALGRTFTLRVLKLLGLAAWLIAWAVVAGLYARVAQNANIAALMMLVAIGGLSPVAIYFGLESSVKRLTRRLDDQ
jgi:hypothetical protein